MVDRALSATHIRELLTLDEAAGRVHETPRTLRRRIASGALPAIRPPGARGYRVATDDLDRLYAPVLRAVTTRPARESESSRSRRQLAEAGIAVPPESK